jgi:electron transfer flavoprotein alpha subunit
LLENQRMSNVLAVLEQRDGTVRGSAREVISAAAALATELGGSVHALLLGGSGVEGQAAELGQWGASVVKVVAHEALATYQPEGYAAVTARVVREGGYGVVLTAASGQGKDLAPRLAALLDVPLASDITGLSGAGGQVVLTRPIYSGKAFARVRVEGSPVLASLRPNVFPPKAQGGTATVESLPLSDDPSAWGSKVVSFEATGSDVPDVAEASVVVAGGRGLRAPEHWNLLEDLRLALGADTGLGASRAVVDAGWRSHGEQVGQTGKTVAPKLYFAVGISGAIQHLAGMRTAGTIVAINRDADAPIFKVADYGIVGDLFEVLPRLTEAVRTLRAEG